MSKGYLDPADGNGCTFQLYVRCLHYAYILFLAVFVVDSGFHVFVWVGKEATPHEKGGGLAIAHVSSSQCVSQWLTGCIRI